jgi:glycosyltransferase involved in cell wall biosynthesis
MNKERLRVAIDASALLGRPTGIGVFCAGLIRALEGRRDLDVQAFAISWRRREALREVLPASVKVTQRAMPARPLLFSWRHSNHPHLDHFIKGFDLVHGTNYTAPPTKKAVQVVSVHDLTTLHFPELSNAATLHYPELIRRAIKRGAYIHADSEFVANEIAEAFSLDHERIRTVHLGIPTLPPPREENSPLPASIKRYILSVGTAEPRKDLPTLVKSFDALAEKDNDLHLVLAGPSGWGEEQLVVAIDAARHKGRIIRTGWVDDASLAALYERAAVLAYPSRYEGFGYPPLQAMAAGVPVVATNAGSLPEVLGDAALLVDVGDAQALEEALRRVLEDSEIARSLKEKGLARAARYSFDVMATEMVAFYCDVVAQQ